MAFEEITKKFNESKLSEPGNIYLPGKIREEVGLAIGDKVELLVDKKEKAILIKTKWHAGDKTNYHNHNTSIRRVKNV